MYVHIIAHIIQIMCQNNLDLSVSNEKRERGPLREVGKRVRVRAYRPKLSRLSSDFCR